MASIVIPSAEAALWITLGLTALLVAICLPAAAAIISEAVPSDQQGQALGSNQSLQVGAEATSGLVGGLLAAVATALPLAVMAGLSLVAASRFARLTDGSQHHTLRTKDGRDCALACSAQAADANKATKEAPGWIGSSN